jgi:uncharacterized protein YcgL (UPF0745 family)
MPQGPADFRIGLRVEWRYLPIKSIHLQGVPMSEPVTCYIYRSPLKDLMYLYLKEKDAFDDLPAPLRKRFGEPEFTMELELSPERKLANADAPTVLTALERQGFYLQLPPKDPWL